VSINYHPSRKLLELKKRVQSESLVEVWRKQKKSIWVVARGALYHEGEGKSILLEGTQAMPLVLIRIE
jgi:hypothetical protein